MTEHFSLAFWEKVTIPLTTSDADHANAHHGQERRWQPARS
jgi:hypothetical protein